MSAQAKLTHIKLNSIYKGTFIMLNLSTDKAYNNMRINCRLFYSLNSGKKTLSCNKNYKYVFNPFIARLILVFFHCTVNVCDALIECAVRTRQVRAIFFSSNS
jgi:hypothetical protein